MFDQRPEDRIREFRVWRKNLEGKPLDELLEETVKFWNTAPLSNQYYSADLDNNWPDPWQLVYDGIYDDISLGLAMFYSLALLEKECYNTVELAVCNCPDNLKLCAIINDELFLNHTWGEIVNKEQIKNDTNILRTYSKKDFEFLK